MFKALEASGSLSRLGRNIAIAATVVAVICPLGEGLLYAAIPDASSYGMWAMYRTLATSFGYLAQQLIYVGVLLFVGAKFFETRTILTVGFANLDAGTMRVRGPDDENTVWVGQRYGSKFEAESMAVALQSRLEASTADKAP
jgi:hypothetical protein